MKYIFYFLILVVIYALVSYGRILYYAKYSQNPKIEQKNLELGSGPALKYLALGDSTAVGEGASSVEKTYTYKIAEYLGQTFTVSYKNLGVRGAKTEDVLNSQLSAARQLQPDIVTISIGANDNTHLVSKNQIISNYKKIISYLMNETKAKIYITNIPNFTGASLLPWPYIRLLEWRSSSINKALLGMENDRVKIINIHDFGWNTFPDRSVTYSVDHFHPSDAGYENWTNAFLEKIKQ